MIGWGEKRVRLGLHSVGCVIDLMMLGYLTGV